MPPSVIKQQYQDVYSTGPHHPEAVPVPSSPIKRALADNDSIIERIGQSLTDLAQKLSPISSDFPCDPTGKNPTEKGECEVAQRLIDQYIKLSELDSSIRYIISKVQV